jgi:dTDP-4-dehydrorhamnose 3,5-epimerase
MTIDGAFLLQLERREDERGFFARSWCQREFEQRGLLPRLVQCNVSFNRHHGTLRGMHSQTAPHLEAKLVRCTRGVIWDVLLDLREHSPSYMKYEAVTLTDDNDRMVFIPEGVFHGFLTLEDNTEVFYQMSEFYSPDCAAGYRWDDPAFDIQWPAPIRIVSDKDQSWPDYPRAEHSALAGADEESNLETA